MMKSLLEKWEPRFFAFVESAPTISFVGYWTNESSYLLHEEMKKSVPIFAISSVKRINNVRVNTGTLIRRTSDPEKTFVFSISTGTKKDNDKKKKRFYLTKS